jgi:hypothetical protein
LKIVNLTCREVSLATSAPEGGVIRIPPGETETRFVLEYDDLLSETVFLDDFGVEVRVESRPRVARVYPPLPDPVPDTVFIVNRKISEFYAETRQDLVVPGAIGFDRVVGKRYMFLASQKGIDESYD